MSGHHLEADKNGGVKADMMNLQHDLFRYSDEVGTQERLILPLKTPDRRLLSSDNTSLEVRKRVLSPTPADGENGCGTSSDGNKRQRQVAKSLFGASLTSLKEDKVVNKKVARCLYGPPSSEEDELMNEFNEGVLKKYEEFQKRYVFIEEIKKFKVGNNY